MITGSIDRPAPAAPYKPRILVVEDEAIVARDIRHQLAGLGYQPVGHAARGELAIAMAQEQHPDLVLMDVQLAGTMDGIAAAQVIRTRFGLPVVFLTAFAESETLERAKLTEPFGYILKPFSERELHAVVEMALYRHGIQARLRRSEARFRTMFEAEPGCVMLLGADAELLELNPTAMALLEAGSADEVRAIGVTNFIAPANRSAFDALRESVLRGGAGTLELEIIGLHGARRWFEVQATPMREAAQDAVAMLVIARDITAQRLAQAALRESEARYRLMVDSSPYAIAVCQDGKLVMANPATLALMGAARPDDLIGWPIENMVHPDQRDAARARIQGMAAGQPGLYPVQARYVRLDGGSFDAEVTATPCTFNGRPAVQVVALDIGPYKRVEAQLRESRRQLGFLSRRVVAVQEAQRSRVAHALNDDIGVLLGSIRDHLSDTQGEAGRLIDQALERVQGMALELRPTMLDDLGLAPALEWLAGPGAAQAGYSARCHLAMGAQRPSRDIETACFRIAQSALDNVRRHAAASRVEITLQRQGETLLLEVADDGCGFDVAATLALASAGTSLGLLGMRERAGLVDGELDITSMPGQGCVVRLRCPWRDDAPGA